jgi:hypothetical protein
LATRQFAIFSLFGEVLNGRNSAARQNIPDRALVKPATRGRYFDPKSAQCSQVCHCIGFAETRPRLRDMPLPGYKSTFHSSKIATNTIAEMIQAKINHRASSTSLRIT